MSTSRTLLAAAAAALALSAGCGGAGAATDDESVVRAPSGPLRGTVADGTRTFSGIRYAQPPTGERRFAAPAPPPDATRTRDATTPGASCPQDGSLPQSSPAGAAEDCLFLNVTTPADAAGKRLPVMVWIHGGGGTSGSGAQYDARRLAEQGDVVVVTLNYRLGALGLLALPGLEGGGTFALADQLAALRWTRRNVEAFGGDPGNVTVFGESQGGFSVCGLLTSPAARGLFQRASMASGNCDIAFPPGGFAVGTPALRTFVARRDAERSGVAAARSIGCRDVACLRRAPVKRLLEVPTVAYAYGTPLLPRDPSVALRRGTFTKVPTIVGTNADEAAGTIGAGEADAPITRRQYPRLLRTAFGADARAVAREYPLRAGDRPGQVFAQVMTDAAWACPTVATTAALAGHTETYAYEFRDPGAPDVAGIDAPGFTVGAGHASDLPFLFDLGGTSLLRPGAQARLGATMVGYWSRFARTGDPNGGGAPGWARAPRALGLAPDAIRGVDVAAEHRCGFWAGLRGG